MASLSLANLAFGHGTPGGDAALPGPATDARRSAAFEDAVGRGAERIGGVERVAAAEPATVAEPSAVAGAEPPAGAGPEGTAARERARRSLDLEGPARPSEGDAILGGLQRLRGTFEARHDRIGALMRGSAVDTETLLSMQMEIAQYTLLVDVSSKLTGKTTQSLDTLMKGQ
ncbi:type III secretion system inner rod subunit SctI [uncultured Methylobacterium sp.]|jgi:type III secretion system YscI/HrpB-like protein|uniref:type III secretion system inner rod subunit SctI n=1 Tax=uncultured Methylobacterium sp. TaxID=157278 RepID=UPI0026214622|nr:type III secretion system inner rod subunit SctI [uncultured Methylobacterium sp.]